MKFIKLLLICFLAFNFNSVYAAHQLHADIDGISIPYGTKIQLQMAQNITSLNVIEGDMFKAYLTKDIYVNNKLVLPAKTIFRGRVSAVKYSRMLSRPAAITLTLDHLVTKDGYQLPLNSGIASNFDYILKSDGSLTTNGNYFRAVARDLKKAGQIVPRTINWGKTSNDSLFTGARILFLPVAALGGSVACVGSSIYNTVADLFRRGDEILIKDGSIFNIILLSTLDIPS